eukprot:3880781-Pleurochrysis_carterae.AAC.2
MGAASARQTRRLQPTPRVPLPQAASTARPPATGAIARGAAGRPHPAQASPKDQDLPRPKDSLAADRLHA